MFTLSGIFLEERENLFQDFWSPFSISFNRVFARWIFFKKSLNRLTGPCAARTLSSGLYKPRPRNPSAATCRRRTLPPTPSPRFAATSFCMPSVFLKPNRFLLFFSVYFIRSVFLVRLNSERSLVRSL